ncbi:hypothetical protein SmJEL517_g02882 [Synchytrium microbalum]|uniref:C2H2-type domain-containing protein n=1 Tax=Synchytrium microbalum TaxID=1806994 RepID=A0A507CAD3_9FUNG|nr:uncharacterized protein SmJEL517_g02882 [Synchytrium microbalum]TPX34465.1 hypothetical protein SmJEL517_g02882 [Synchytrium microbalum]
MEAEALKPPHQLSLDLKRKQHPDTQSMPTTPPSDDFEHQTEDDSDDQPKSKRPRLIEPETPPQTPREEFRCNVMGCNKVFEKRSKLNQHEKTHSDERPHVCPHPGCGKAFRRADHLRAHTPAHATEVELQKPFVCTYTDCESRFRLKHQLTRHEATHQTPKPFHCTVDGCEEAFAKREQLRRHVAAHSGQKPFVCTFEGCAKSFESNYKLSRHVRSHASKAYLCDQCDEIFDKWSLLQKHVNHNHVIKCEICVKTFTRQDALVKHYDTHDPSRDMQPCTWPGCARVFTTEKTLQVHIKTTHEQERSFKCTLPDCGAAFTSKVVLDRHLAAHNRPESNVSKRILASRPKLSAAETITGARRKPDVPRPESGPSQPSSYSAFVGLGEAEMGQGYGADYEEMMGDEAEDVEECHYHGGHCDDEEEEEIDEVGHYGDEFED